MKNLPELPKRLKIEPTEQDIRIGICNSPTKCMYAMTLRRMFPALSYVRVNPNGITITYNGKYYHYYIPARGALALLAFDNTKNQLLNPKDAIINCDRTSIEPARYRSTPEIREYHRQNSAKRRADPNYQRSDLGQHRRTLRARIANSVLEIKKIDHAPSREPVSD